MNCMLNKQSYSVRECKPSLSLQWPFRELADLYDSNFNVDGFLLVASASNCEHRFSLLLGRGEQLNWDLVLDDRGIQKRAQPVYSPFPVTHSANATTHFPAAAYGRMRRRAIARAECTPATPASDFGT